MKNLILFSVDIIIIFIVFLSFVFGWARGITKEILSVAAWIGGIYLSIVLFPYTKEFARSYISHGLIADFVTACALFILFLTTISLFNYFCSNFIKKSVLNITDKALGGVFGIVRGIIIVAILDLTIAQFMPNQTPNWLQESRLRPTVTNISDFVILILPNNIQTKLLSHINQVKKQSLLEFIQNGLLTNVGQDVHQMANNSVIAQNENDSSDDEYIDDDSEQSQTAEELATLKPKKIQVEKKESTPNTRERNDMDRLLDQYDDVDEQ